MQGVQFLSDNRKIWRILLTSKDVKVCDKTTNSGAKKLEPEDVWKPTWAEQRRKGRVASIACEQVFALIVKVLRENGQLYVSTDKSTYNNLASRVG